MNLSDAEIIKAMEHKVKIFCETCKHKNCDSCVCNVAKQGLDLINRLKADIEERTDQFDRMSKVAHKLHSELVSLKVGIEKLKENAHTIDDDYSPNGELTYIEVEDIDNLLKKWG